MLNLRVVTESGSDPETAILFSVIEESSGAIVGEIRGNKDCEGAFPSAGIHKFLIFDEFRRKGYGKQALAMLEAKLKESGIASIRCWMQSGNLAAQALCQKAGFRVVGTFMRKKLSKQASPGTVSLKPMAKEVFESYIEDYIQRRAETIARAHNRFLAEAMEAAKQEYRELFPGDAAPEGVHLLGTVDESSGISVGVVWFGMHNEGKGITAFIEDFLIYDKFRRRGYGMGALMTLENKVSELGGDAISLFVQAHNQAAQRLYLKAGYEAGNIEIERKLT